MQILILDDDPERHDYFRKTLTGHMTMHTSTYRGAVLMLSSMPRFDVAYLDRDLNDWGSVSKDERGNKLTGEDVADFIVNELPEQQRPKQVVVHSQNEDGAQHMFDTLDGAGIYTTLVPFPYVTVRA